jgi:gluconolactonase|tara:strand:+ start:345 stop:1310 length:966 start_codon:yes stop_codon:yes gene_type:complete
MNLNIPTLLLAVILLPACTSVIEPSIPKTSNYRVTVTQPQSANFVLQDLVSDGVFTQGIEGPAVDQRGNLYAVNYRREGTIGVVRVQGNHKSQSAKLLQLPEGSIGNGIRFNAEGEMFVADYAGHNVLKIDPASQRVEIYAHDARMHQPNDLAIAASGIIYASDPNWSANSGQLWRIDLDGQTTLLESSMGTTNGIEISPDERLLYVNESVQRRIWVYDLDVRGGISNKRLFHQYHDFGLDGMRCDSQGNLFVARYGAGRVDMLSPKGDVIRQVKLVGKFPTNVAFGGVDGRSMYVTLQQRGAIETFRVPRAGRSHFLWTQ